MLFFDIETVPSRQKNAYKKVLDSILNNFRAPTSLTKADILSDLESIGAEATKSMSLAELKPKWESSFRETKAPEIADEIYRKQSLNGNYGEVLSIACEIEPKHNSTAIEPFFYVSHNENVLLTKFNDYLNESFMLNGNAPFTFCGHNIIGFDLPFLYKRMIINGIKPSIPFNYVFNVSPFSEFIYDTMARWNLFSKEYVKLESIAEILDIEVNSDVDGSMIYDMYRDGSLDEILEYNKNDVRLVQQVFKRMTFKE